jgi:cell wall-associated NlpC family hydrolase
MSSVSGLSDTHRIRARDLAMEAAFLGLERAPSLHYTQGPKRWEGIAQDMKAWRGECPHYADCSAFATWCLWNGLDHYGVRDVVNDAQWRAGYTGTMLEHGKPVVHEENIMRADLALYGVPGTTGKHVAICIGGGLVISHGSEGGPYKLPLHYRSDLIVVRRYI